MNTLKLYKTALLALAVLLSACGKDEDPEPNQSLANLELVVPGQDFNPVIPAALESAGNQYSNEIVYLAYVSTMYPALIATAYAPLPGAETSNTPVQARTSRQGEVLVYYWETSEGGIAYQLSELEDGYRVDLFIKESGESTYLRVMHAEQNRDGSQGNWALYSEEFSGGSQKMAMKGSWTWDAASQDYAYILEEPGTNSFKVTGLHRGDASGELEIVDGNNRTEMQWQPDGSGWWKAYEYGVLTDQGSLTP